jgi:hypothetical protein
MKIARATSAMMMPTISTSCWYFLGTANFPMIRMNTKRLSTLSEYSVSQPVRNSTETWWVSPTKYRISAKTSARPT